MLCRCLLSLLHSLHFALVKVVHSAIAMLYL